MNNDNNLMLGISRDGELTKAILDNKGNVTAIISRGHIDDFGRPFKKNDNRQKFFQSIKILLLRKLRLNCF
jgi:hypothetical protein